MKFEGTKVFGIEAAITGMRLPMNLSYEGAVQKSDTGHNIIGEEDLKLAQKLIRADQHLNSQPNSKFMRMIHVQTCITAPAYWWAEFDTYKVGTTRDSSSMQHKGTSRVFTLEDFEIDLNHFDEEFWNSLLGKLNAVRNQYLETKDYNDFRELRQLMPMSYRYTAMVDLNYAVIRTMVDQRKHHLLKEWSVDFMDWVHGLPYAQELLLPEENQEKSN